MRFPRASAKILFGGLNDSNGANRPQEKGYEFALPVNSQLIEQMPQMRACRGHANREFTANALQIVALNEQRGHGRFGRSESEQTFQDFLVTLDSRFGISDKYDYGAANPRELQTSSRCR